MSSTVQMPKLQGTVLFDSKDNEVAYVSPANPHRLGCRALINCCAAVSVSKMPLQGDCGAGSVTRAGGACLADTTQQTFSQRAG